MIDVEFVSRSQVEQSYRSVHQCNRKHGARAGIQPAQRDAEQDERSKLSQNCNAGDLHQGTALRGVRHAKTKRQQGPKQARQENGPLERKVPLQGGLQVPAHGEFFEKRDDVDDQNRGKRVRN